MIQSKVLETYSPIIIPVSFLFGLNLIEKNLLYDKVSFIGILLFTLSIFLFTTRIKDPKYDTTLNTGAALFVFFYILFKYVLSLRRFSLIGLLISLILIGQGIIKYDIYDKNNQLIYISLFLIYVYLLFYRGDDIFHKLPGPSVFYTILVLSSIDTN